MSARVVVVTERLSCGGLVAVAEGEGESCRACSHLHPRCPRPHCHGKAVAWGLVITEGASRGARRSRRWGCHARPHRRRGGGVCPGRRGRGCHTGSARVIILIAGVSRKVCSLVVLIILVIAEELSHGDSLSLRRGPCPGCYHRCRCRRGRAQGPCCHHTRVLYVPMSSALYRRRRGVAAWARVVGVMLSPSWRCRCYMADTTLTTRAYVPMSLP